MTNPISIENVTCLDSGYKIPSANLLTNISGSTYTTITSRYTVQHNGIYINSIKLYTLGTTLGEAITVEIKNVTTDTVMYTIDDTVTNLDMKTYETPSIFIDCNQVFSISYITTNRNRHYTTRPVDNSGNIVFLDSLFNTTTFTDNALPVIIDYSIKKIIPVIGSDSSVITFNNSNTAIVSVNVENAIKEVYGFSKTLENRLNAIGNIELDTIEFITNRYE